MGKEGAPLKCSRARIVVGSSYIPAAASANSSSVSLLERSRRRAATSSNLTSDKWRQHARTKLFRRREKKEEPCTACREREREREKLNRLQARALCSLNSSKLWRCFPYSKKRRDMPCARAFILSTFCQRFHVFKEDWARRGAFYIHILYIYFLPSGLPTVLKRCC